ncbi:MAG: Ig-like domain-containing domain [Sulfuricaulis sp.]
MSVYRGYSRIFNKQTLAALALSIFVAGCGGGGGGGTGSGSGGSNGSSGPIDTTAPTVSSISPDQDAAGIPSNVRITATFSEAMAPALITAMDPALNKPANFRLSDGTSYLSGTVSYDAANNIAVFTPSSGFLAPNIRYTATIITGIKDLDGNQITRDFAWDFVPGATPDTTAPTVTSTIPVNADSAVAVNREIVAGFSEDMNSLTLTPANFTVTGPNATAVPGTVKYIDKTAIFTPSKNLASNTTYTATIGAGVTDIEGNAGQANVVWSFATGATADSAAPVVITTSPADTASGVAINTTVNASFNEPMDPTTITTANFLVTGPGTAPVIGTVAFDSSTNTAIFTRINHLTTPMAYDPKIRYFEPNTTYTATLTTGAKDLAGNPLASDRVWSFTTAP